jgi:tripartite-type tricarboxylate transporter receptor subunit TctC
VRTATVCSPILVGCLLLGSPASVGAAAENPAKFYHEKTVKLIVSAGAGGGYDLFGRTLAAHFGRHIPGSPSVVVENMTGAGGLRAAAYMYDVAPKDGTEIALIQSTALLAPDLGNEAVKFNPENFTWIGNISGEYSLCVSWHSSPIRTVEDLFNKQFVVGSSGAGSAMQTYPNILDNVLGAHIKVISGYTGGASVLLAMQRGEVQGRCGASLETYEAIRPNWVKDHLINLLLQTSLQKDPQLPNTPWIMDYAKTDRQKAILELVLGPRLIQRPIIAPPNIPKERARALRDAFDATMADPEFLADARTNKLEVEPMRAAKMAAFVQRLAKTPKAVRVEASQAMARRR